MLAEGRLAAGVTLKRELAEDALAPLQAALGLSQDEVARGIITIATVTMANAIREITVERGEDPRDSALVAFGGAGPVFGTLLARELGIRLVLVPSHAGNFSAWGLLNSDISQSASRTQVLPLADESLARAAETLERLFAEIESRAVRGSISDVSREASLDLRYLGQEHTLSIGVPVGESGIDATAGELAQRFAREYDRVFGHSMDEQVEVVHVRATARTPLFSSEREVVAADDDRAEHTESVTAFSFRSGCRIPFRVLRRESVASAGRVTGPAILIEPTATTYVDIGFSAAPGGMGVLLLHDEQDENRDR
jgi:N-methylhydantoinase A